MSFIFNEQNKVLADEEIAKYPKEQQFSAVMGLLTIAQKQNNNYLSLEAIEYVAEYLKMPIIKVMEVATFYSMYNLSPVGKYHIKICGNVVCHVKGGADIIASLEKLTGATLGCSSEDGMFTLSQVECLGACCNAPVMQINDDYVEDLNLNSITKIIEDLKNNNLLNPKNSVRAPIHLVTENK